MQVTDTLQRFGAFLAGKGLRLTAQRRRVVQVFVAAGGHLTAEALYQRVRRDDPAIGLTTVYRTLKLLEEAGLAAGHTFGTGVTSFEPTAGVHHHDHLVCRRCGAVTEFVDDLIEELQRRVAVAHGFVMDSHRLEIYGLCRECAGRQGEAGEP